MEARPLRGGYVASNLIAAFVTGADGNFDVAVKVCLYAFEFDIHLVKWDLYPINK